MAIGKPHQRRTALVATFTFPPDLNGVAMASSLCVRTLLDDGWAVDVATSPAKAPRMSTMWEGASIHEFDIHNFEVGKPISCEASQKFRNFLSQGSWDLIVFQSYSWPLYLAQPLLSSLKSKIVLISHGHAALRWTPFPKFPFGLAQWSRSAWAALKMFAWNRHVDRWVFLSEQSDFDAYLDHSIARIARHPGRRVIPNGVELPPDLPSHSTFRSKYNIDPSTPVFLCIAYYSRGKDQGFAVKAFREANIPGSVMVFIGTEFNEWSRKFQAIDDALSGSKNNGRIIWLENVSRTETLDALAECDVFILPSHLETQPISILEAMAHAKPWIARKAGCVSLLPGGLCIKSPSAMAAAMKVLSTDSTLAKKLRDAGNAAARDTFNHAAYARSYRQLFDELVPKHSASSTES